MIEKYRKRNEYFNIIDNLLDPIIVFKKKSRFITFINYEAELFLEKSKDSIIGLNINKIFLSDSPLQDFIVSSLLETGNYIFKDAKIILNDKSHVLDVEIINNNKLDELVIIFKNHRKKIGKKNFDSDLYFLDQTISILGHEIKNPLSSIKVSAQIMQNNLKKIDSELIEIIVNECDRINDLVNSFQINLSDFSVEKKKINIHEPLRYILKKINLKKHENIMIYEEFDPSLPEIEFDKNNLTMIFENLLNNSIQAIGKQNGYIKIKTSFDHQGNRSFPGTSRKYFNNYINIMIEDNGS